MDLGQMFLVGFTGLEVAEEHWIVRAITEDKLGGVILFDRSVRGERQNISAPDQLKRLIGNLQQPAENKLFIAVDQEGGMVCRLKEQDGFQSFMSAGRLAQLGVAATREQSHGMAAMLAQLGINLNFTPVIDLNSNPDNPIIGKYERSFGSDPVSVVDHAQAVIASHHQQNVACCVKHFPGHGSSSADSHLGFVDISDSWSEDELQPYRELVASGYCDGIMTAHVIHRGLDDSGVPATLSAKIIQTLLREEIGFRGVTFSDDLQMGAIRNGWSYKAAVQAAVLAGVDVLLVGNNLEPRTDVVSQGIGAIVELLDSGRIDENHIRGVLNRIALLKQKIRGGQAWKNVQQPTAWQ